MAGPRTARALGRCCLQLIPRSVQASSDARVGRCEDAAKRRRPPSTFAALGAMAAVDAGHDDRGMPPSATAPRAPSSKMALAQPD